MGVPPVDVCGGSVEGRSRQYKDKRKARAVHERGCLDFPVASAPPLTPSQAAILCQFENPHGTARSPSPRMVTSRHPTSRGGQDFRPFPAGLEQTGDGRPLAKVVVVSMISAIAND
jgi:hypothetical protein